MGGWMVSVERQVQPQDENMRFVGVIVMQMAKSCIDFVSRARPAKIENVLHLCAIGKFRFLLARRQISMPKL